MTTLTWLRVRSNAFTAKARIAIMSFCYRCGLPLEKVIPAGDDLGRECCAACGFIHYENPRILVSCVIYCDSKILWIRRGLNPRKGFWARPAGFMEQGESLQEATVREVAEETGLQLDPSQLELSVLSSLVFINQVYVVFRASHEVVPLVPPRPEIEALSFLTEDEVPWQRLAYPATESYMRNFYCEVSSGRFETYLGEFSNLGMGDLVELGASGPGGIAS
jgi:ADP-ribose pyrophosphatase YjhB (NUDIX family)